VELNMMLLQSIGDSCYFGSDPMTCLVDQCIAGFGGEGGLGLLAGSLLFAVFYILADGEMAVPTVVLLLTGGVIVPMLPGQYARMSAAIVLVGLGAAVWKVLRTYVSQ